MNLKQIFCSHIWKDTKTEFLRKIRESDWAFPYSLYKDYSYYAVTQVCLKCDKTRIIKDKRQVLE